MSDVIVEKGNVTEIVTEGIQGPQGPPGASGDGVLVVGEVPAGLINGVNATFQTAFNFVPETVDVTLNGLRIKKIDDYNTSGTQQIILNVSPATGENVLVNYLRS